MPDRLPGTPWRYVAVSLAATGLIAALALMGTPGPESKDDDRTAVAILRELARAQRQFAEAAAVDTDGDGLGEYGFLGELAGGARLRIDTQGRLGHQVLRDPLLPLSLAAVVGGAADDGAYLVQVFLPGPDATWVAEQDEGGGAGRVVDVDAAERTFRAFAWPLQSNRGQRAFFVDQLGVVHAFANRGHRYVGRDRPVAADAPETDVSAADAEGAPAWQALR